MLHDAYTITCYLYTLGPNSLAADQLDDAQVDRFTLLGDVLVVQVVEVAGLTLEEFGTFTQGQKTILRDRPASSVDGASLRWRTIKLELSVGDNGTNSTQAVSQDGLFQSHGQVVVANAGLLDT